MLVPDEIIIEIFDRLKITDQRQFRKTCLNYYKMTENKFRMIENKFSVKGFYFSKKVLNNIH